MIFTSPLMLLGLSALPVLAAIYWLRSHSQRAVVSSLAFWTDQRAPRRGGRILHRMQTPLTLFLELFAIAMMVLAAAGPVLLKRDVVRPLIVVLDDSYSMLAGAGAEHADSTRQRAEAAVVDELRRNNYVTRFLLAGSQPRFLGEPLHDPTRASAILAQWTCQSPTADLPAAMAVAAEVGGPSARILALTDHAPAETLAGGQTEWRALGQKLPNLAFTAATRTRSGENQRVLLEVANLSDSHGRGKLMLESATDGSPLDSPGEVDLSAGVAQQFFLNLPADAPPLVARLDDDALQIDNRVVLLPESSKPLRVVVDVADAKLRRAVAQALEATAQTVEVTERPELVICDRPGALEGDAWRLEILAGKDAVAYAGPFVVDHSHSLAEGLSLQSVIWSASSENVHGGLPIVTAGNVPLLTESEDFAGRRRLQMPFATDLSNLQVMPDWPIFFANLIAWRRGGLPGLAAPNVRLGQVASVALPGDVKRVEVISPSKDRRELEVRGRRAAVPADQVGQYEIGTQSMSYSFACNTVSREESDLSECQSGRWGSWDQSQTYQDRRINLSWIFLLAAITAMTAHMALIAKDSGRLAT